MKTLQCYLQCTLLSSRCLFCRDYLLLELCCAGPFFFVFLSFCFAVTPLYPHESIELNLIYTVAAKFAHSPRHLSRKQIAVWGKLMKVLVESSNTPTNFPPGKIHFVSLSTKLLSFWKKNNFKTYVVLNVKGSIFCQKLACAFCVWMVFTFIQEWIDDTI